MSVVGLLFPGEMGTEVGSAARAEVIWASEGRSDTTAKRAAGAGFRDVGTLGGIVQESSILLSICPPAIAEEVADQVAAAGFGGLYVEANAIAPARVERISDTLGGRGIRMVDGSIIGATGVNLYLSGAEADVAEVAALFSDTAVSAVPLAAGVGAASALKMAFGGWNKIGIALAAQAHAIARAYGVDDALASEGVDPGRFVRSARKAWRWAPEMEEVAATCEALGLPAGMGEGAAALYRRWDRHRDGFADVDALLADLLGRPAKPS